MVSSWLGTFQLFRLSLLFVILDDFLLVLKPLTECGQLCLLLLTQNFPPSALLSLINKVWLRLSRSKAVDINSLFVHASCLLVVKRWLVSRWLFWQESSCFNWHTLLHLLVMARMHHHAILTAVTLIDHNVVLRHLPYVCRTFFSLFLKDDPFECVQQTRFFVLVLSSFEF